MEEEKHNKKSLVERREELSKKYHIDFDKLEKEQLKLAKELQIKDKINFSFEIMFFGLFCIMGILISCFSGKTLFPFTKNWTFKLFGIFVFWNFWFGNSLARFFICLSNIFIALLKILSINEFPIERLSVIKSFLPKNPKSS